MDENKKIIKTTSSSSLLAMFNLLLKSQLLNLFIQHQSLQRLLNAANFNTVIVNSFSSLFLLYFRFTKPLYVLKKSYVFEEIHQFPHFTVFSQQLFYIVRNIVLSSTALPLSELLETTAGQNVFPESFRPPRQLQFRS